MDGMDDAQDSLFDLPEPERNPVEAWPFAGGVASALAAGAMAPDWAAALADVSDELVALGSKLDARREEGESVLPEPAHVLRALRSPLAGVRVLIVGQDPYPTPGHPIGLSFATEARVRPLPRSLQNIYKELTSDTGIAAPTHGDLSAWADQGVLLLNRVLTVGAGNAGSHRSLGWQHITDAVIAALVARQAPLVAVLWGKDAQSLAPALRGTALIESAHPSPLSARRGFFGSRPFSRVNELLAAQGSEPIDWSLPMLAGGR